MKVFKFRVDKSAIASVGARMEMAAKTGIPDIREDEIVCGSVSAMFKLASTPKFEVFEGIVEHRPDSLYELAQVLGRDQGQVLKEAKSLEALGLIKLISIKEGGREKLKAEPLYEKIVFEVEPKQIKKIA